MRIAIMIIAVFFTIEPTEPVIDSLTSHDFHYSRLNLDWNPESSTWQAILRVFTDDLEEALSRQQGNVVAWRLGDDREHPKALESIEAYSSSHWQLIDTDDGVIPWQFVGKEVDYDLTFIYLETDSIDFDPHLSFTSDGFFELFTDQVNEISVNAEENSRRIWLTSEDPSEPLFPPHHD
jgi:hypothetical protein